MTKSNSKRRRNPNSDNPKRTVSDDGCLKKCLINVAPSNRCWKCKGTGMKFQKATKSYDGPPCKVCSGEGVRKRSKRSRDLASAPGKILNLRGYPRDHSLRKIFPDGFAGPRAAWGGTAGSHHLRCRHLDNDYGGSDSIGNEYNNRCTYDNLPKNLIPCEGEVVGSLGCGDWRIYQIADGNKLTVDDFVCAWVAAEEMRKRGHGNHLHSENPVIQRCNLDDRCNDEKMFGGKKSIERQHKRKPFDENQQNLSERKNHRFNHADIGTGCGSVLMTIAWAFFGEIRSIGVEAQPISFNCLRRGLEWNLGRDGTTSTDVVQIRQIDLRNWDGNGLNDEEVPKAETKQTTSTNAGRNNQSMRLRAPYHLITGTPPYFPLDSFVASQNHEQKVRCRVPTRGGAPDYIEAASRFLIEENENENSEEKKSADDEYDDCPIGHSDEGVFCMVEASFDKAEAAVLHAVKKFHMRVRRRVDVITRSGLPPRFSCWVMTKKRISTTNQTTSKILSFDKASNKKEIMNNESGVEMTADDYESFPIETFTLRNEDLTRTKEYSNAMEIMGWVDFEKSKIKNKKTLTDINAENAIAKVEEISR